MAVPGNCVFGEHVAHNAFIIFIVRVIAAIVTRRQIAVPVTITVTIAIVTILGSVAGVVGRVRIRRILVGSVWVVAPVPAPPKTPPRWKADNDDFIETVKATKPIISIKVQMIKVPKAQA
jgi:hypothetical protein